MAGEPDRIFRFRSTASVPGDGRCCPAVRRIFLGHFLIDGIGLRGDHICQLGIGPPGGEGHSAGLDVEVAKLFVKKAVYRIGGFLVLKVYIHIRQAPFVLTAIVGEVEGNGGGITEKFGVRQQEAPRSGKQGVFLNVQCGQKLRFRHAPFGAGIDQKTGFVDQFRTRDEGIMGPNRIMACSFGEVEGGEVGVDHRAAVEDEALTGVEAAETEVAGVIVVAARFLQIVHTLVQLRPVDVAEAGDHGLDGLGIVTVDGDGHGFPGPVCEKVGILGLQQIEIRLTAAQVRGEVGQEFAAVHFGDIIVIRIQEAGGGVGIAVLVQGGEGGAELLQLLLRQLTGIFVGVVRHGLSHGQGVGHIGPGEVIGNGQVLVGVGHIVVHAMVRGFRGLRGGRGGLRGGGEGAAHGQGDQQDHGGDRQNGVPGPDHQQLDPLPDGPGGAGHGGGGEEQLAEGGRAGQTDEGPAIVAPLALAKTGQRALVTGQLRIGPADLGGEPNQGIVPVEHETEAAKHGPDVVAVAVVGQLVLQHMGPDLGALGRVGSQVDGGPEKSEDTGGGHRLGHIHGKQARGDIQRPPPLAKLTGQMDIAGHDDGGHQGHTAQPDALQKLIQVQLQGGLCQRGGLPLDDDGVHGAAGCLILGHDLLVGRIVFPLIAVFVGGYIRLSHGGGDVHLTGHGAGAEITGEKLDGHQQTQKHDAPQGVLQPQTDPAPEQKPPQQDCRDQNGRGNDPLIHHGTAPPRPCG